MMSVRHPTSPPTVSACVPIAVYGTRFFSEESLVWLMAAEFYHMHETAVNKAAIDLTGQNIAAAAVAAQSNHGPNIVPTSRIPATRITIATLKERVTGTGFSSSSERYR